MSQTIAIILIFVLLVTIIVLLLRKKEHKTDDIGLKLILEQINEVHRTCQYEVLTRWSGLKVGIGNVTQVDPPDL